MKGKITGAVKGRENQIREGGHCEKKRELMDSYCQRKYVDISPGREKDL